MSYDEPKEIRMYFWECTECEWLSELYYDPDEASEGYEDWCPACDCKKVILSSDFFETK